MTFPVVIGADTILESAFSGTGYTTAFLELIEKLGNYCSRLPYGTSTSSVTIGIGPKTFTVQVGRLFVVGDSVRAFNSTSNYMEGTVTSYDELTGALVVEVTLVAGSGTLAVWNLVPSGTVSCPMPMSRGGSPATSLADLPKALGKRNKNNVMVCESNFFSAYSTDPYYKEVSGTGLVKTGGNLEGLVSGKSAGIVLLSVPAVGDEAFLSYGDKGFIYLGDGGDCEFHCRALQPSGDGVVVRMGMMADLDSNLSDQFQGFGFGFELIEEAGSYYVVAVINDGTNVHRSQIDSMSLVTPKDFCARYCASDGTLTLGCIMEQVRNSYDYPGNPYFKYLKVSVKDFFNRLNSGAVLKRAGLLRPFFYAKNSDSSTAVRSFPLDSFVVTRYIRRG